MVNLLMSAILVLNGVGAIWFSYYLSDYLNEADRFELHERETGLSSSFWALFGRYADDAIYFNYRTCVWIAYLGGIVCLVLGVLGLLLLEPLALL